MFDVVDNADVDDADANDVDEDGFSSGISCLTAQDAKITSDVRVSHYHSTRSSSFLSLIIILLIHYHSLSPT